MLPSSLAEERRNELEAEMVAVQDKILKATKMLPSNLSWNGKPDTLSSFVERFEEWVEIRMGAEAALVLAGSELRTQRNEGVRLRLRAARAAAHLGNFVVKPTLD